jgi:hypothetical protein
MILSRKSVNYEAMNLAGDFFANYKSFSFEVCFRWDMKICCVYFVLSDNLIVLSHVLIEIKVSNLTAIVANKS